MLARAPEGEVGEVETLEAVKFSAGRESYAVEMDLVSEVRPLISQNWSPVPCTPDFIFGVVNIRGRVYSIMDAPRFLGLPRRPASEKAHLILVRGPEEMALCLLSDDVPQPVHIALKELHPPSEANISPQVQPYIRGVTSNLVAVLNLKRLLADKRIVVHEEVT